MEVRKRLWDQGLKFILLYPSKFSVVEFDLAKFLETPEAAVSWLDSS